MKPTGPDRPPARTAPDNPPPDAPPTTRQAKWLWLAVVAMLIQQAFSYMSTLVLPIAAPAISESLGLSISLVGLYTAILYVASTLSAGASGSFIQRFGALRVSQTALVLMGLGLLFTSTGIMLYPLLFGAILEATGSYAPGFVIAAVPALYTGLRMLLRRRRPARTRA